MFRLTSIQGHRRSGVLWLSFLLLVLTLAFSGAASATVWHDGDVITYSQGDWGGDPAANAGAALLVADFATVYAGSFGVVTVGLPTGGFAMSFTDSNNVLSYLPASGTPGALDANLDNPTTTSSGVFGGDVLALELNVDFSDAGFLLGSLGIPFGNLVLENFTTLPALNGLTVRQFLGDVNTALGGGTPIYSIADLDPVTASLNNSFFGGDVTQFALDHLVVPTAAVPEPSTMLLLGSGLIGLAGYGRKKIFKK